MQWNSNNKNIQKNNPSFQNRNITPPKMQNYTYIGRCRCGYGPNAYYQDRGGKTFHITQINQNPRSNQKSKSSNPIPKIKTEISTPKIEMYRVCNKCGARVRDDAYFCTQCGNEMGDLFLPSKKEQIESYKNEIKKLKNQIKLLKRID